EQSVDRFAVRVASGSSGVLVDFGAVPNLGGLIKHEQSRYWSVLSDEVSVQGEVGDEVVADPVLAAADPGQSRRAVFDVCDYGQAVEVEADALAVVFQL